MKLLITSRFKRFGFKPLDKLIKVNRLEYCKRQNYRYVNVDMVDFAYNKDLSWRHPEIVLQSLEDSDNKFFDFIVNTGQNNLVTNFDISIESQIEENFDHDKHEMILQSYMLDPKHFPLVLKSINRKEPLEIEYINKPYLGLMGE